MGTLKTTLKVESTDLFPTPVNFTTVNNNSIGSPSNFVAVSITNGIPIAVATLGAGSAGGYLYLQAPSTNTDNIIISESINNQIVIELLPGDVGFVPIGDNGGSGLDYEADTAAGTQVLNYYFGAR